MLDAWAVTSDSVETADVSDILLLPNIGAEGAAGAAACANAAAPTGRASIVPMVPRVPIVPRDIKDSSPMLSDAADLMEPDLLPVSFSGSVKSYPTLSATLVGSSML